jgi:DNA polymerase-3 subunit alpha
MVTKIDFCHTHVHTTYSLLDGISHREDLLQKCKNTGMSSMAVTEHGSLYNHIGFYKAAVAANIKPILGIEAYFAPDSRHNRKYEHKKNLEIGDINAYAYHLILLAKNHTGYKNLIKLSSLSNLEGFYKKPRIDLEILNEYKEGIIVTSACIGSIIGQSILQNRKDLAQSWINKFRYMFGEDFYLELMHHHMPEDKIVSEVLIDIGTKFGIPLILTGDSHYTNKIDAQAHEATLCIATKRTLMDEYRWRFEGDGYWFKSPEEMHNDCIEANYPSECVSNTILLANKIEDYGFRLASKQGHIVPQYKDDNGINWTHEESHQKLTMMCWEGMNKLNLIGKHEYEQRLTYELDVIERKNFSSYFLIIADIIDYIGTLSTIKPVGRGSSIGSLVCYTTGITAMDPIRWGIPFYRFINEGRKDLPDIDTDMSKRHRKDVINYIMNKYGKDHVAQISTFQKMTAKKVIDDVGASLDIPPTIRKQVSKLLGETDKDDKLDDVLNDQAKNIMQNHPGWIEISKVLEGVHRNMSLHAAGIVISNTPLTDYVPLGRDNDDGIHTTQYDMVDIQDMGLLKLDMLGLRNIDIIYDTVTAVKDQLNISINPHTLNPEDKDTYKLISNAEFVSTFQYDSSGMRQLAKRLLPDKFEHLMAINALYRPGCMQPGSSGIEDKSILDVYVERKHGRLPLESWHQSLDKTLETTYGLPIYQEQISEMSKIISKFNDTEADEFRSAIGKKVLVKLQAALEKFKTKGIECGHSKEFMEDLASRLTGFARYGWNRGHACGYSFISYITAYLEAHHPVYYYTALLNSNIDKSDRLTELLSLIMQKGIVIKAPDVNKSSSEFSTDGNYIYMGLSSVRQMGVEALCGILWERSLHGPFEGFLDFIYRVSNLQLLPTSNDIFKLYKLPGWNFQKKPEVPEYYKIQNVNKTVIENLVKAGSFSFDTALTDKDKIAITEKSQKIAKRKTVNKSNYDLFTMDETAELCTNTNFNTLEQSKLEREALNFYISNHPVNSYIKYVKLLYSNSLIVTPSNIKNLEPQHAISILSLLTKKDMKMTKNNKPYLVLQLQDQFGEHTVRVWDPLASDVWPTIQSNQLLLVNGTTKEPYFEHGLVDVYIKSITNLQHGLPISGFIMSHEDIKCNIKNILDIDIVLNDIPGYGLVAYTNKTLYLTPDVLQKFETVNGIKLILNLG